MKHHIQTTESLDKSIQEANALLRKRTKDLEEMKANSEHNKVLIEKLDREYGIVGTNG